jgi:hypothetical protein
LLLWRPPSLSATALLLWCLQVEGAPTVVKKGIKKEEAEEIKKKLEAGKKAA